MLNLKKHLNTAAAAIALATGLSLSFAQSADAHGGYRYSHDYYQPNNNRHHAPRYYAPPPAIILNPAPYYQPYGYHYAPPVVHDYFPGRYRQGRNTAYYRGNNPGVFFYGQGPGINSGAIIQFQLQLR